MQVYCFEQLGCTNIPEIELKAVEDNETEKLCSFLPFSICFLVFSLAIFFPRVLCELARSALIWEESATSS